MLTNFFLAILLIAMAIGVMVSLDTTTSMMVRLIKHILKMTHRSKLLTEYILRAYMRYRKAINKPIISNT
ncbi:hypothetical protein JXD20_01370 [Candidatus Peregrinibacteria bacterium]|nr:hypothetical protein [Candidatus Peregrinibacteria bacterium]